MQTDLACLLSPYCFLFADGSKFLHKQGVTALLFLLVWEWL